MDVFTTARDIKSYLHNENVHWFTCSTVSEYKAWHYLKGTLRVCNSYAKRQGITPVTSCAYLKWDGLT